MNPIRSALASVALQLATALISAAMPHAADDDRLATRSAAMRQIGRHVGAVKGSGAWTVSPSGLVRAALATAATAAVSGAAMAGTLGLAVAMVSR